MTNLSKISPADLQFLKQILESYLSHRPLFYAFIRPQEALLFHQHRPIIKPPILDFGCGDGFFAYQVFGAKTIDVGLDVSSSRIQESPNYPAYKKTVIYNGHTIPFPDNHFQTVISNCVFEHLPDINQNLREIHRVLRPGGHLLTTVMTNEWEINLLGAKILGKSYQNFWRHQQQHPNLFSQKQWLKTITDAGLTCQKQIGYEGNQTIKWNEISHYLSFFSLFSYKLFRRWVIFPTWHQPLGLLKLIEPIVITDIGALSPAAIFIVSTKI